MKTELITWSEEVHFQETGENLQEHLQSILELHPSVTILKTAPKMMGFVDDSGVPKPFELYHEVEGPSKESLIQFIADYFGVIPEAVGDSDEHDIQIQWI